MSKYQAASVLFYFFLLLIKSATCSVHHLAVNSGHKCQNDQRSIISKVRQQGKQTYWCVYCCYPTRQCCHSPYGLLLCPSIISTLCLSAFFCLTCIYPGSYCLPWMLSICPSFNAAPLTLQSVRTIRSALASERKGLESKTAFLCSPSAPLRESSQWHLGLKYSLFRPMFKAWAGF